MIFKPNINEYIETIYITDMFNFSFFSCFSLISDIFHESIVFGLNLNCLKWIQIHMIVFCIWCVFAYPNR